MKGQLGPWWAWWRSNVNVRLVLDDEIVSHVITDQNRTRETRVWFISRQNIYNYVYLFSALSTVCNYNLKTCNFMFCINKDLKIIYSFRTSFICDFNKTNTAYISFCWINYVSLLCFKKRIHNSLKIAQKPRRKVFT